jgi:hypothetical protein
MNGKPDHEAAANRPSRSACSDATALAASCAMIVR